MTCANENNGLTCQGSPLPLPYHTHFIACVHVCSRHCVMDGTRRLGGLTAFDGDLTHVALFPAADLAVLRGPEGPHFKLAGGGESVGEPVSYKYIC